MTSTLKTQILGLYAYRYPVRTLQKIHEPYSKLSEWQLRRTRAHARECGPVSMVEKSPCHRVRLPPIKIDHFLDFANRPYFYQDVSFSTRKLRLSSGEKITMPSVIRKVTRSTMVKQYLQFCEEEQFEPLSRSTLFRILEVSEASRQKSLSGLDNTAADGLDQIGLAWQTNCGEPSARVRGTSKPSFRVTARKMRANVPSTVVSLVSTIQTIQISRNNAHINTHFSALNATRLLPFCRRCNRLLRITKP